VNYSATHALREFNAKSREKIQRKGAKRQRCKDRKERRKDLTQRRGEAETQRKKRFNAESKGAKSRDKI
jgi:hypothetical protein